MRVLIIGGTGNISTAITEQLMEQAEMEIVHYNRGNRESPDGVQTIIGDRRDFISFEQQMKTAGYFDCVIDMIGFLPDEVESAIRAFKGKVGQYIFCSTVDVYTKQADYYPIDEKHSRKALPSFAYGYNKMLCEELLLAAHDPQTFAVTIFRPAQTYGGTGFAVASLGDGTYQMKRLRQGHRIIIHGDGTSIWAACHRSDVARAFIQAIGNPRVSGKAYNVTAEEWMTYDRYWRIVAEVLGAPEPHIVHIPTDLLGSLLPNRAEWCVENFQHPNIFDNTAARNDLGFSYTIPWSQGIQAVIRLLDENGAIDCQVEQPYYDSLLEAWEEANLTMKRQMQDMDSL
ncbi:NAD-dependent epimerase/dehydratase family protein [Paenibacillus psychroresistens]|uniref:NAD-dependent epimerase/dehydratase family protein n=1 Tax=Paenibacillus psychroresistens TaxID=1778678 RepID=A0A6B8RI20_9BACL|nr:NAD-dependent epimerase/dehydratase family protein [Paenibacillus psychroresistens]QGQ94998.1 NAD-dependent epimerase/dehydratase family protein [Paenibacillus psychroresistens]